MASELDLAIKRSAESGIIDLSSIDLDLKNPELVATEMGDSFQFSGLVENQVANDVMVIDALLPHLDARQRWYIDNVWKLQELAHGQAHDMLLEVLGIPPIPVDLSVTKKIQVVGGLNEMSEHLHRVFNSVYTTFGTIHEREAQTKYAKDIQLCRALGETGLVRTMLQPIVAQEPQHLQVYRQTTAELWQDMAAWEKWLARQIAARTFSPVGTSSRPEMTRPHFGRIAATLFGRGVIDFDDNPVIREAAKIMEGGNDILPKMVAKAFRDCIDEARDKGFVTEQDLAA